MPDGNPTLSMVLSVMNHVLAPSGQLVMVFIGSMLRRQLVYFHVLVSQEPWPDISWTT
jgi:hypothetical protein